MWARIFLLFLFLGQLSFGQQEHYPTLNQIVTDEAQVFTAAELTSLREKLTTYEARTSHQVVVLTIQTLQAEPIAQYANAVFNKNGLGQEELDNGVLIVLSKSDREVRIEVGYGLEGILTDALCRRIIEQQMIPNFKEQDYFLGIDEGTNTIIRLIDDPEFAQEFAKEEPMMPLWGKVLLMLFVGGFLSFFLFFGSKALMGSYKNLINIYRGVLSGKIGVLLFPLLAIGNLLSVAVSLIFTLMPLVFFWVFLSAFALEIDPFETIASSGLLPWFTKANGIWASIVLIVVVPLLIALYRMRTGTLEPFEVSWTKNDKRFMKKHLNFSSSGTSSFSGGSSFSSSSSSFSGGGGSSGGGGASGSW